MRTLRRIVLVLLAAAAAAASYNRWISSNPIPWRLDLKKSVITNPELEKQAAISLDDLLLGKDTGEMMLVDARSAEEYAEGHIPGAINVPIDEVESMSVDQLVPMDVRVVVYCEGADCYDSGRLYDYLKLMGYEDVRIFKGGMSVWRKNGMEIERGDGS